MSDTDQLDIVEMSADLIAAFVSNNSVSAHDLPGLIAQVHGAFADLTKSAAEPDEQPSVVKLTPAQIRKSITPDALISFVDGKPDKTLKRHLGTHGLKFEDYRERYGLPSDYPTVAPNYSAARSTLAKSFGLGQLRQKVELGLAPVTRPKRVARLRKAAKAG